MPRRVIYRPEFDDDCRLLGGIAAVQEVIDGLVAALEDGADPNAFGLLDVGTGVHYVPIKAVGQMPELLVALMIDEDDDAVMLSVDRRF